MRTGKIFDFMSGDANSIVEPRGELLVEPCGSLWFYFGNSYDIVYSLRLPYILTCNRILQLSMAQRKSERGKVPISEGLNRHKKK